jgi:hypothetical protein
MKTFYLKNNLNQWEDIYKNKKRSRFAPENNLQPDTITNLPVAGSS